MRRFLEFCLLAALPVLGCRSGIGARPATGAVTVKPEEPATQSDVDETLKTLKECLAQKDALTCLGNDPAGALATLQHRLETLENGDEVVALRLTVTAPSVTPYVHPLTSFLVHAGGCAVDDASWATTDGGCMLRGPRLVFSTSSGVALTWNEAVWGGAGVPVGNVGPDAHDARTNDYDPAVGDGGMGDASSTNYCHSLLEGGHSDWRPPTKGELSMAATSGAGTRLSFVTNQGFWASTVDGPTNAWAVSLNGGGSKSGNARTVPQAVVCVREPR